MAFDDQLKKLENLKVGNVEKVIGEIGKHKYDIQEASDETYIAIENYKSLMEEKLPKIIDNINIIGSFIYEAGPIKQYWLVKTEPPLPYIYTGKFNRESFSMWVDCFGLKREYGIEFVFKDNSNSLRNIFMYTLSCRKLSRTYERKRNHPFLIKSEELNEFSSRYVNMIINEFKRKGKSDFTDLPPILNQIPQVIEELYKSRGIIVKRKLGNVQSHIEKLKSLDITDF